MSSRFVPLKVALFMNTYQNPKGKEQYHELTERYQVDGVPTFVVLSKNGIELSRPNLHKRRQGVTNLKQQTMAALAEGKSASTNFNLFIKIGAGALIGIVAAWMLRR